jgi:hypothetical protein
LNRKFLDSCLKICSNGAKDIIYKNDGRCVMTDFADTIVDALNATEDARVYAETLAISILSDRGVLGDAITSGAVNDLGDGLYEVGNTRSLGESFLDYVRPDGRFDASRVRELADSAKAIIQNDPKLANNPLARALTGPMATLTGLMDGSVTADDVERAGAAVADAASNMFKRTALGGGEFGDGFAMSKNGLAWFWDQAKDIWKDMSPNARSMTKMVGGAVGGFLFVTQVLMKPMRAVGIAVALPLAIAVGAPLLAMMGQEPGAGGQEPGAGQRPPTMEL